MIQEIFTFPPIYLAQEIVSLFLVDLVPYSRMCARRASLWDSTRLCSLAQLLGRISDSITSPIFVDVGRKGEYDAPQCPSLRQMVQCRKQTDISLLTMQNIFIGHEQLSKDGCSFCCYCCC